MALKKRAVVSPAAGAVSLPSLMAELPGTRRLEEVPLDKLSPAPAAWNFYAPLPDDKLLELIESIRTSELLHPIVVWKQPDGDLMILSGHNRVRAYTALLEKTGEDKYHRIPATVLTDISADEAHEIVVDSNYVQRVLTPSEKARSISQKYALAGRKKRSRNGVRKSKYEQIGEEYNLSARQIARYGQSGRQPAHAAGRRQAAADNGAAFGGLPCREPEVFSRPPRRRAGRPQNGQADRRHDPGTDGCCLAGRAADRARFRHRARRAGGGFPPHGRGMAAHPPLSL